MGYRVSITVLAPAPIPEWLLRNPEPDTRHTRFMNVLITGITGFVGGHLAERLLAAGGCAVAGIARHAASSTEV